MGANPVPVQNAEEAENERAADPRGAPRPFLIPEPILVPRRRPSGRNRGPYTAVIAAAPERARRIRLATINKLAALAPAPIRKAGT